MGSSIGERVLLAVLLAIEVGMTRSVLSLGDLKHGLPRLGRWIALTIVAGTLLAILGPFGSYMNGAPLRLFGYWVGSMLLGLLLYGSAYRLVGIWRTPGSRGWWLGLTVAMLLASVPEALATRAAAFWLWPELTRFHLPLPLWFAQTATIGSIAMTGIGFILRRPIAPSHDMAARPSSKPSAVTPLGGDVLALQMEDHYVRVHRPAGTELILMPLGRAIDAMQVEGLRTHRSWWVASHAVAGIEGNARSMRLRLSNGVVAPVARSAVIHLKTAGWIANSADSACSSASA